MTKQPEFRKYLPLEAWFRNQPTTVEQIELSFDQVEAILDSLFAEVYYQAADLVDQCRAQDSESSHGLAEQWLAGH